MPEKIQETNQAKGVFDTTHWSLVLAAGESGSPDFRQALTTLCQDYWYPIFALIRHEGHDAETTKDLTQGFFTHLVEKRALKVADPQRGRFRSFLKASVRHYLANERRRDATSKRCGRSPTIALDFETVETRRMIEPGHDLTPEKQFEKEWARTMLRLTLTRLREENARSKNADRLRRLESFLTGDGYDARYGEIARGLQMSDGAVRGAVHRMRRRFGELLREEVAQTVKDPKEVEEEIRYLFAVLNS